MFKEKTQWWPQTTMFFLRKLQPSVQSLFPIGKQNRHGREFLRRPGRLKQSKIIHRTTVSNHHYYYTSALILLFRRVSQLLFQLLLHTLYDMIFDLFIYTLQSFSDILFWHFILTYCSDILFWHLILTFYSNFLFWHIISSYHSDIRFHIWFRHIRGKERKERENEERADRAL